MGLIDVDALTEPQAARRRRVLVSALELAAEGGYEAVQMRDVAARADVALGTIYRYFSSKDHLLAAAMNEWMADLERQVGRRPPTGASAVDRVIEVLGRAQRALGTAPLLAAAVIAAQTSGDPDAARAQEQTTEVMHRILAPALGEAQSAARLADLTRVLGHVWFSCLIVWANGLRDLDWVADEVRIAARLLLADVEAVGADG